MYFQAIKHGRSIDLYTDTLTFIPSCNDYLQYVGLRSYLEQE
jgi:hypothetical protein